MPRSPPSFSLRPAPAVAMLWRGKSPRQATVPSSAFIRFRRDEKENYDLRNLLFNAWFLGCSIHFLKLFALAPGHSQPLVVARFHYAIAETVEKLENAALGQFDHGGAPN